MGSGQELERGFHSGERFRNLLPRPQTHFSQGGGRQPNQQFEIRPPWEGKTEPEQINQPEVSGGNTAFLNPVSFI